MAKIEPMTFPSSEPWIRHVNGHVTPSTSWIGREVLEQATKRDEDGDTLLHISVAQGNEPACRKLLGILKSANMKIDVRNNLMQTPLHVACVTDNPELSSLLLSANPASCDITDRHGNNSVHLAVKYSTSSNQYLTLRNVINAASMKALEKKNIYGLAPIHVAATEGNHNAIRLLKKAGVDINLLESKAGASPIILATRASQRKAAQALLELGANPNIRTTYGESASQLASAKGDHVISELLALYDTPYEVTKHSSLPRYSNFGTSVSDMGKQNILSRHHEVNLKPFIHSHLANSHPFTSQLPQATSSTTIHMPLMRHDVLRVKSERKSPIAAFPSNNRKQSEISIGNQTEANNQPLNFVMRKPGTPRGELSPTCAQQPKRKLDENEPLDLSSKRAKISGKQSQQHIPQHSSASAQSSTKRTENYVFVQPLQQQTQVRIPPQLYYKVVPRTYATTNHASVNSAAPVHRPTAGHRPGYQQMARRLVDPRSLIGPAGSRHVGEVQPHSRSAVGKIKESLSPEQRNTQEGRHNAQTFPSNHKESRHQERQISQGFFESHYSDQPIRRLSTETRQKASPVVVQRNGMFNPFQPIVRRASVSRDDVHEAHVIHDTSRSISKHTFELRDKYQRFVEVRDPGYPITNKGEEAREPPRPIRQHSHLEQQLSLPITYHSNILSHDDHAKAREASVIRERQNSVNRERRYQSDDRCRDNEEKRPAEKPCIVRRNSAPGGDKLDLRSYTGCLPPHFLHLLESSGNLPIKASNALRNVSDVLGNKVTTANVIVKQEPAEATEASEQHSSTSKDNVASPKNLTKLLEANGSPSSPKVVPTATSSSCDVISSKEAADMKKCTSTNHFESLGKWTGIEEGEYPAFGKIPKLPKNDKTSKVSLRTYAVEDFRVNEKYLSDQTKLILKNARKSAAISKRPPPPPPLSKVLCLGKSHTCPGCSNPRKGAPEFIGNILKFTPINKYVTSPHVIPTEVVYCGQMSPIEAFHRAATPPVTKPTSSSSALSPSKEGSLPKSPSPKVLSPTKSTPAPSPKFSPVQNLNKSRQKTMTRRNDARDDVVTENKEDSEDINDDILANSIENSSDEEDQEDKPMRTQHVTSVNGVTTANSEVGKANNGFHEDLPHVIKKTILKNLELRNELIQKLRDVQAIVTRSNREEVEKDIHYSDLEISDDEDEKPNISVVG